MRTLCLDFDERGTDIDALEKRMDIVADAAQVSFMLLSVHPTARGCHVLLRAMPRKSVDWVPCPTWVDHCNCTPVFACQQPKDLTPMEVVALQLLLGSDPMREAYNFQRARILGDVPGFWREMHRWNVDYSEKL